MGAKRTFLKYITVGGLVICLTIVLVSFYIIISNSFGPYAEVTKYIFSLPHELTTRNYSGAWRKLNFVNSLKNTVIISALFNFDEVVFSSMCGYWITRHQNRRTRLVFFMLIAFISAPFQAPVISFVEITDKMHLTNSLFELGVCPWALTVSISIFITSEAVKSVPIETEESALVDGCSSLRACWTIIFPLIKASVSTSATTNMLWFWNDYLMTQLMLSKKTLWTMQVSMQALFNEAPFVWDVVLVALTLVILPLFISFVVVQKQVLEGASAGAVKGQRKRTSKSCYRISTIFINTTLQRRK